MADDNKIEIQIVLDDGSIVKGFQKIEQQAATTAAKASSSFSEFAAQGAIIGVGIGIATTAMEKLGSIATKVLDEVFEGEKLKLIEKQFKNLSESVGVASETLSGRFKDALGGLVDDSQGFAVLNEGLSRLGTAADKLPEVFELARKATNLFGGDAITNFQKIEEAVANGNTRTLRSIGLRIDDKKALDLYARSLGTTTELLSEEGRQQALLNAVLEKGADKLKAISVENGTATESLQRLKVTLNNLTEEAAVRFSDKFSSVFKTLIDGANSFVSSLTFNPDKIKSIDDAELKLKALNVQLAEARKLAPEIVNAGFAEFDASAEKVKALEASIAKLNAQIDIASAAREEARKSGQLNSPAQDAAIKAISGTDNGIDKEKARLAELAAQTEFQNQLLAINQDADRTDLNNELINEGEREQLRTQQELAELDHTQKINALYDKFYGEQFITEQQFNQLVEAEENLHNSKIESLTAKSQAAQVAIVKNGLTNGIASIGAALAKGENLFEGFGKAVVGIFGDLFIHIGQGLLFQGLAIETFITSINSLFPGSGAAAAAAGLGLILFGGALKALAGGGGGASASTSAPGAGGGAASGLVAPDNGGFNPGTSSTALPSGPKIEVNIAGNVLDTRETGMHIVELINGAFQQNGAVITGAV